MDKDALKKSVAMNLRCVTQSCKGGVPLSSLQIDYKALIGTTIPFIELGYKSLESFLQSIPAVVCLKKNKGGQCVVEGVADASTAHIASLISRQKTTTKVSKKSNSKKPSLPIRKYPCHESWKSAPTNQVSKTCTTNPANPKVPMPKPVNSGTIGSTSRKIVSANQNNVIHGQSNTKANPLDAGPSNSAVLFSSLFTDSEPLIRPPVPASGSQKQTKIQEKATSPDSSILISSKKIVPLSNAAEESTLSKRQLKKRRKKATENILSNSSESPLTKSQRKNRRRKIKKAEKLHETTQMFLKVLNENCTPPTLLKENQSQESYKFIEAPSTQCPLETFQPLVRPTATTVNEPLLPSFCQGKPPGSAMPKETASNFVHKSSLNCFPSIRYSIKSAKFSSLLMMNFLLFGDDSYMETLKRGILAFDGFSFCKGSEQWKQKEILLSMLSEDTLRECLKLLCIECISDNKKELVNKLLQFLASLDNTLSNNGEKKTNEKISKKKSVDKSGAEFGSFDSNILENLKQIQEYVHNQEFKSLSRFNVNCASTSKSSDHTESVQVCQSENLNGKNQSAQISSEKSTSVESEQFRKLQSVFSLNSNSEVLASSTEMSTDAASNSSCKSKSYHYQSSLRKKKKKKQKATKSETDI